MTTLAEWIETQNNKRIRRKGIAIGDYLIVASDCVGGKYYKIYRKDLGIPFISAIFEDKESALKIANLINDLYADYFAIWDDYPDADIISLAKWSVKNGIDIFELVKDLNGKSVNNSEIPNVWKRATSKAHQWFIK